ncbi:hypothetical protein [Ferrimonas marina]|uniref:Uncharacterized protein n=1 Tax=Ferrimonas marina TaxID=299255 RepID=A0A1M5T977_9GAMM|nr:hypothetical protein [Ferrimonas marina]SHH46923.1 hypothetical protein SAMN02745129_2037 [Ferrimonas marina]
MAAEIDTKDFHKQIVSLCSARLLRGLPFDDLGLMAMDLGYFEARFSRGDAEEIASERQFFGLHVFALSPQAVTTAIVGDVDHLRKHGLVLRPTKDADKKDEYLYVRTDNQRTVWFSILRLIRDDKGEASEFKSQAEIEQPNIDRMRELSLLMTEPNNESEMLASEFVSPPIRPYSDLKTISGIDEVECH